jgi:hypothetical protein
MRGIGMRKKIYKGKKLTEFLEGEKDIREIHVYEKNAIKPIIYKEIKKLDKEKYYQIIHDRMFYLEIEMVEIIE